MKDNDSFESRYTFWRLISEYKIEIPIIQRDYAQGRISYDVTSIRTEFLETIYDALVNKKPINFDFVYGTVSDGILYPLDGQQRLTTFYLLHWYLAEKEKKMDIASQTLKNFSYKTRASSREFCELLTELEYEPQEDISPSEYIRNDNGYFKSWDNDSSVKHMLVMLDAIHSKFFNINDVFESLISDEKGVLTFNYLPMEHYALTDDLYIKMNARGKSLSPFENFKAKFIQHLRTNDLPYEHFEKSIDSKWTDLLWDYRDYDNTMDDAFLNYFCFITEMLYLENAELDNKDGDSPFSTSKIRELISFYDTEEKVLSLYAYLDLWQDRNEIDGFANEFFSTSNERGKIRLFDWDHEILSCIIEGANVTLVNKILIYAVMKRMVALGKNTLKVDMLDYIRIVRNYLLNTRFFISKKCTHTSDFRFCRHGIPVVQNFISVLYDAKNLYKTLKSADFINVNGEIVEREKAKARIILKNSNLKDTIQGLEDLDVFKGVVFNVLPYVIESNDEDLVNNLELLFVEKNLDILRALLSVSDYGIKVADYSVYGPKYYYGNIDNWYDLFSYNGGEEHTKFICNFISQFENTKSSAVDKSLREIINNNIKEIGKDDWRYTLLKYDSTLENNDINVDKPYYLFALQECTDGSVIPHRINGYTLNGAHVIPDFIEVANQLKEKSNLSVAGFASEYAGSVKLVCSDDIYIMLDEDGEFEVFYDKDSSKKKIEQAIEKYDALNLLKYDRVEKCVILANLVLEKFSKKKV